MNSIKVLLVVEHNLTRVGIRLLLQAMDFLEIVGESKNGEESLKLVEELRPNIILMDLTTPLYKWTDIIHKLKEKSSETKIVILSSHNNKEYVWQVMKAGASGYLFKDSEVAELRFGIRAAMNDQIYVSPRILEAVVTDYLSHTTDPSVWEFLTGRQREILKMISMGCTNREIAQRLGIAPNTAEVHRAQLMQKLGIQDTAGLIRYAIRVGLVSADE